jgi:hypothetical protein
VKEALKEYLRRYYNELRKKDFDIKISPGKMWGEYDIYIIKDTKNEEVTAQLSFRLDDDITSSRTRTKN